jgi:hypothetical protein
MARSEARLQLGIWRGLEGLSAHARLLYVVLLTEPTMNHAGVGAIRMSKWAANCGLTVKQTADALEELATGEWVVTDSPTEEVLVRTMIRNDGVADQPNVLKGAIREALQTESSRLRRALAVELKKLPPKRPDGCSKSGRPVVYPDPHAAAEELAHITPGPEPPEPFRNPSGTHSEPFENGRVPEGFGNPSRTPGGGGGGGGSSSGHLRSNSSSTNKSMVKSSLTEGFAEFWTVYPRRVQKRRAEAAWLAARRRGIDPELIIKSAHRFAESKAGEDLQFVPHPASWLNAGAYDDEPEPPPLGTTDRRVLEAQRLKNKFTDPGTALELWKGAS